MRLRNIIEGIRMGFGDLSQSATRDYTIGFEFEITVDSTQFEAPDDESMEEMHQHAYSAFVAGYDATDFVNNWFNQNVIDKGELRDFIEENEIETKYGLLTDPEEIIEFEQAKFDDNLAKQYSEDELDDIQDLLLDVSEDPEYKFDEESTRTLLKHYLKKVDVVKPNTTISELDEIIDGYYERLSQMESSDKTLRKWASEIYHDFFLDTNIIDTTSSIFGDEKRQTITPFDDISTVAEMFSLFKIDRDELREILEMNPEFEEELNDEISSSWENHQQYHSGETLQIVRQLMGTELGLTAIGHSSTEDWAVVEDGTTGVDAEIISPVMNIDKGIHEMQRICQLIEQTKGLDTNTSTGLHINIGTWSKAEYNSVDWLKFLMIVDPKRILDQFFRTRNEYTVNRLPQIMKSLQNLDLRTEYFAALKDINSKVIDSSPKFSAVNFGKLRDLGYIELRAPGNTGYTKRSDEIITLIRKVVRALELASDPTAVRQQYLKRLYQYLPDEQTQPRDAPNKIKPSMFWKKYTGMELSQYPLTQLYGVFNRMIKRNQAETILPQMDADIDFNTFRELYDSLQQSVYVNDNRRFIEDRDELFDIMNQLPGNFKVVRMIRATVARSKL